MVKKIIIVSVLMLALAGCSVFTKPSSNLPSPTPLTDSYTAARNRLYTNILIKLPKSNFTVTLTKEALSANFGDHQKKVEGEYGSVTIGDQVVFRDSVGFSTIAINYDGLGEVFYLAAFEPSDSGWEMVASQELGRQIRMQSIQVIDTEVAINYVEHGPGQDLAEAPNVEVKRSFIYLDQNFSEVK